MKDASNQKQHLVSGTRLNPWTLWGCGCGVPKGDTDLHTAYSGTMPGALPKGWWSCQGVRERA